MSFTYFRIIRLGDTDGAGVVYFSNLLSICHEAYEDFITASGINFESLVYHGMIALPIVHGEIDFFKPIFCGDRLIIELTSHLLKNYKFEINYQIYRESTPETILATATTRHLCIDQKNRHKTDLPEIIKKLVQTGTQIKA